MNKSLAYVDAETVGASRASLRSAATSGNGALHAARGPAVWPARIDLNGGSMPHSFFRIDINSKLLRLYGVTVSLRTLRSDENGNFGETHIAVSMPRLRPQL